MSIGYPYVDNAAKWQGVVATASTIEEVKRVDTGKKFVMFYVHLKNNNTTEASEVTIYLSQNAAGAAANAWKVFTLPANEAEDWKGFMVLEEADRISVECDRTDTVISINGHGELIDPPV